MTEFSSSVELARIKADQAELDKIRENLAQQCSLLDARHWIKRNFFMGICEASIDLRDPALQSADWIGGIEKYYLSRNGRLFMGLEHHYDEGDNRIYFPEILREATLDEYREYSPWALEKLDLIKKSAVGKAFIETEPDVYDLGSLVTIRPYIPRLIPL